MHDTAQRCDFALPAEDIEYLAARGLKWETVRDGKAQWLFVHEFPIPPGYNVSQATAGVRIAPGYPDVQIDMVYFRPALSLPRGIPIGALSKTVIIGTEFQQWSRHRTAENPWRPGVDNLHTHLSLVEEWLWRKVNRDR